jgi:hypothetical protein
MAKQALDWLHNPEPTRKKSGKQEKNLQKMFGGKVASNSGARFGENDVLYIDMEIEAKTTEGLGYRITIAELQSIKKKCRANKTPVQVIEFQKTGESYAILPLTEFERMISELRSKAK